MANVHVVHDHFSSLSELPEGTLPFLPSRDHVESAIAVSWAFPLSSHDTFLVLSSVDDSVGAVVVLVESEPSALVDSSFNVESTHLIGTVSCQVAVSIDF